MFLNFWVCLKHVFSLIHFWRARFFFFLAVGTESHSFYGLLYRRRWLLLDRASTIWDINISQFWQWGKESNYASPPSSVKLSSISCFPRSLQPLNFEVSQDILSPLLQLHSLGDFIQAWHLIHILSILMLPSSYLKSRSCSQTPGSYTQQLTRHFYLDVK